MTTINSLDKKYKQKFSLCVPIMSKNDHYQSKYKEMIIFSQFGPFYVRTTFISHCNTNKHTILHHYVQFEVKTMIFSAIRVLLKIWYIFLSIFTELPSTKYFFKLEVWPSMAQNRTCMWDKYWKWYYSTMIDVIEY